MNVRAIAAITTLLAACAMPLTAVAQPASARGPRSLCAPPADTVGPSATSVTFGRPTIDLDTGSRAQHVTVAAQDTSGSGPASGVARVRIEIAGNHFYAAPHLTLTSGTATSGRWTGTFTVSKYAHPGTYRVDDLTLADADGNTQDYPGDAKTPEGPDALSFHPADDPTFQVTGTPATRPPRIPAGRLKDFTASTTHVDTTGASRRVRFTARFTGPRPARVVVLLSSAHKAKGARFVYESAALHVSHGLWSGSVRIRRWLGDQHLAVTLYADYGSHYRPGSRRYDASRLHRLHLPSGIAVTSGTDHTSAKITALMISPDPIDSTDGTELVTVTAKATDTGSGVHSIDVDGSINHGVNGAATGSYPYAASGIGFLSSDELHVRLHRTTQGTWSGTTKVRQCVPSGTYKLSADTSDVAGNVRYYSTSELAKAHLLSTVDVTSKHGDIVAPEVYSAATYGADHELFLNFSEGVARVDTSTLSIFALSPKADRYVSTTPVSAIECSNGTTHVDCSGDNGLVTSAKLTVPGMTPGTKYEVYANLDQVVPQLTDGTGNPLDWNYAAATVLDS
ncbi:hypothetical protein [Jatrophihabitans endophyticus]|uniref:hypothetical protein n=1 Tax=Jatrophihabitans endophyticus TaxID=1206085 RepID=UPI0019E3CF1A|nr:hypothetical protein [Jatrophihabitans endophyticus]MBE7189728.1 hypothetical protein [Jatrophihabitans endophyticus]